ncbi:ComEA family DNA-binding protein [Bhargavaea cecembensis]|nr:helix-hairpin-helix domain-containing protein [Bhargavaea cecembensis]
MLAHREQNGPFGKPEDLMEITGIGEKTFARLEELITVK